MKKQSGILMASALVFALASCTSVPEPEGVDLPDVELSEVTKTAEDIAEGSESFIEASEDDSEADEAVTTTEAIEEAEEATTTEVLEEETTTTIEAEEVAAVEVPVDLASDIGHHTDALAELTEEELAAAVASACDLVADTDELELIEIWNDEEQEFGLKALLPAWVDARPVLSHLSRDCEPEHEIHLNH